jgi:hypothetical protein
VANELTQGLLDGSVLLEDEITPPPDTGPSFYPTDESSLLEPTPEDSSLGPEKFSMGQIW